MDYVEDEGRPRFLFQTRSSSSAAAASKDDDVSLIKVGKLHAAACFSTAAASILLLFFLPSLSQNQTLSFLLIWTSLSLLAAPFAPPPLTGGDARVGSGELLPPPPSPSPPLELDPPKRIPGRRPRSQPTVPPPIPPPSRSETSNGNHAAGNGIEGGSAKEEIVNEKEWGDEDFEILKKQISRHPAGEPRRWERIAEAFKGRHGIESVISMAKSMSERRPVSGDSFARFLKQRKPLDKRAEAEAVGGLEKRTDGDDGGGWNSGEDLALLNALKAFPKDASMRWEKIAAAIPGKSKACCMKRVAELKKGFRSSKASET